MERNKMEWFRLQLYEVRGMVTAMENEFRRELGLSASVPTAPVRSVVDNSLEFLLHPASVVPPQDTALQDHPTDESLPPHDPSPSEPASISPELELSLQRIAEAASERQGTPLPERYLSTHASISFAKPIVKPKNLG
jgi:hypothetical protein